MTSNPYQTVSELIAKAEAQSPSGNRVIPTGFTPLDEALGGGLRVGDVSLLAGTHGIGRTVTALQWARNAAVGGTHTTMISDEHASEDLLERLLVMEARLVARSDETHLIENAVRILQEGAPNSKSSNAGGPLATEALERVQIYGQLLTLIGAESQRLDMEGLEELALPQGSLIIIDQLKSIQPESTGEFPGSVRSLVSKLKAFAVRTQSAVLITTSPNRGGINDRRLRISGLLHSTELVGECDLVMIINEKATAVANVSFAFNPAKVEQFAREVIFTIEKNRRGPAAVHIEFTKDYEFHRLIPAGAFTPEKMYSDLLADV